MYYIHHTHVHVHKLYTKKNTATHQGKSRRPRYRQFARFPALKPLHRQIGRQKDNHTDRQKDNHTDRQKDNHTDRQTDNHTDRQTDNYTDRQTQVSMYMYSLFPHSPQTNLGEWEHYMY